MLDLKDITFSNSLGQVTKKCINRHFLSPRIHRPALAEELLHCVLDSHFGHMISVPTKEWTQLHVHFTPIHFMKVGEKNSQPKF